VKTLITQSGTQLATAIRNKTLRSREAVDAHIERVLQVNPRLNAMVRDRFDEARREADAADDFLKDNPAPADQPFFGVPCSIKECFALRGMPNTGGLVSRVGVEVTEDATAVARMRKAGAIPLGVTNISELCMWMESNNMVYGRTGNPYNPAHIVGGSSGGEAAIIAAGGAPFGLGSDIGGSIRMPAFFNGIFGHKPTGGLVPNTGQFPSEESGDVRYLATGPMARRCEDIWPLVNILAGPDGQDHSCLDWPLGDPTSVDLSSLKVYCIPHNGRVKVSQDVRYAQDRAARALEEAGANVVWTEIPELKHSFEIWSAMLKAAGGPTFKELMADGKPFHSGLEVLKMVTRRSEHTFPALGLAILESFTKLTPGRNRKFVEQGKALRQQLVDLLGTNGILLYPPYPTTAPRHNRPLFPPFNWVYTAILNVMELPVTQVPIGFGRSGLPSGIQVGAVHGNDHVTVAVAMELERQLGGWTLPVS